MIESDFEQVTLQQTPGRSGESAMWIFGEEDSRQRKQHVQRPRGSSEPKVGQEGWN